MFSLLESGECQASQMVAGQVVTITPAGVAQLSLEGRNERVWAEGVLESCRTLHVGDRVLATSNDESQVFVVGVLQRASIKPRLTASAADSPRTRLRTPHGAYAELSEESSSVIRVACDDGTLLFEYDSDRRISKFHAPQGDLELAADKGDLNLRANGMVRIMGQSVEILGGRKIRWAIRDAVGKIASSFTLQRRRIACKTEAIELNAKQSQLSVDETAIKGQRCDTEIDQMRLRSTSIETTTDTLVESANNVYRNVKDLAQIAAGRMKTFVDSIYHFRTKTAYLRSDDDFKIQGDQIHLG